MSTVRDLIRGSLRLLGAIAQGETPSAEEQADAFSALIDMLGSWSTESLLIFNKGREVFPLVSGQQSYTMGPSGNFNTVRPLKIEDALLQIQGSNPTFELPIKIVNQDEWVSISVKTMPSTIPINLYVEDTSPLATLNLWPIPSVASNLILYSWKPLDTFASVDSDLDLPPGYAKALRYNLALELAPEYGREPSASVLSGAIESKENIKRMNIKPTFLKMDEAVLPRNRTFNWMTGE